MSAAMMSFRYRHRDPVTTTEVSPWAYARSRAEAMAEMRSRGMTFRAIGNVYGVSRQRAQKIVSQHVREGQLPSKRSRPPARKFLTGPDYRRASMDEQRRTLYAAAAWLVKKVGKKRAIAYAKEAASGESEYGPHFWDAVVIILRERKP